ncbi:diacylglycerol kinase family protein [Thalassobacillus sp. CUG 92003]|uniref:diacylglycerol/lipid kinase family protein n=1 Tax=Thalassobacillus sp. CUG 92003 TaxID=2736641 RepID=UPI0015E6C852|nr:diacylglycerol kinase family protein [Thalassobacillus sp. CUG 92003]
MYIIIVNPMAGHGRAKRLFDRILKEPEYKSKNCRSFITTSEGHAKKIAEQVAGIHHASLKAVIVVGGDGTFQEVLNGLTGHPAIPLAFIPAGSGNDFARGLQQKKKGVALFKQLLRHHASISMLPGLVINQNRTKGSGIQFANSIGTGLDGEVVRVVNQSNIRKWLHRLNLSPLLYVIAFLKVLRHFKSLQLDLKIDGTALSYQGVTLVTVTNHSFFGNGMKIAPQAKLTDRHLSVIVVRHMPKVKLLLMFLSVFIGKHTYFKEVDVYQASEVKIQSDKAVSFQIDGQSWQSSSCTVIKSNQSRQVWKA